MSKTNPFAGLMAGFRGARAEEEKPEDQAARDARRTAEDEQRQEEDARRAEEDQRREEEDARRAEEDGTTDDSNAKKADVDDEQDGDADAEDGDDEAGEDMNEKEAKAFRRGLAIGRARENVRGSRIFLSAAKVGRPDLAATLAFTTRNTSAEAERLMGAAGAAPRARTLDSRMANRTDARPGAGAGSGAGKPEANFGDQVAAALKKVGR